MFQLLLEQIVSRETMKNHQIWLDQLMFNFKLSDPGQKENLRLNYKKIKNRLDKHSKKLGELHRNFCQTKLKIQKNQQIMTIDQKILEMYPRPAPILQKKTITEDDIFSIISFAATLQDDLKNEKINKEFIAPNLISKLNLIIYPTINPIPDPIDNQLNQIIPPPQKQMQPHII